MAQANVPSELSVPLYEPAFAARLVGLSPARIRRWVRGYAYQYRSQRRSQKPVVERGDDSGHYLSFLDLMELYFAKAFLDKGFSLQRIRKALKEAQAVIGNEDHPFARQNFLFAGSDIFLQVDRKSPNLLHLLKGGQWAIAPVIEQYAQRIDFLASGEAAAWWPLGKTQPVVIDPQIAFGAPVVAHKGIRTGVLYDFFLAEKKNLAATVSWFALERREVEAAVLWEDRMARAA